MRSGTRRRRWPARSRGYGRSPRATARSRSTAADDRARSGRFLACGSTFTDWIAMSPVLAIYPGSFDPITMGHVDIIQRGARLFERIVVAVLINADKAPLFSVQERVDIAREVFRDRANVEVDTFDGLLVDYARRKQAGVIVKGLRAVSDFEYEMQMALMNRRLNPELETVFMMPTEPYTYVSSRLVKEVVALGGSVKGIVPDIVERRLREKKLARETLRA